MADFVVVTDAAALFQQTNPEREWEWEWENRQSFLSAMINATMKQIVK